MPFFVSEKIGPKRQLTPEGFLLCMDVPIARTGTMEYLPEEVGLEGGSDGIVRVLRDADELFSVETLASFEGKPVTMDHPDDDVDPDNWQQLAAGTVHNVRRGEGEQADLMLADLLITRRDAINAVMDDLREISCGYLASYVQIAPGRGKQREIRGNHTALVLTGRCGLKWTPILRQWFKLSLRKGDGSNE